MPTSWNRGSPRLGRSGSRWSASKTTPRRQEVVEEVGEFLGLAREGYEIELETIYNRSSGKPMRTSTWKKFAASPLYQKLLRRVLSPKLRLAIYRWILPAAPEKTGGLTGETRAWLQASLEEDVHQLSRMLGLTQSLWEEFGPLPERVPTALPSVCAVVGAVPGGCVACADWLTRAGNPRPVPWPHARGRGDNLQDFERGVRWGAVGRLRGVRNRRQGGQLRVVFSLKTPLPAGLLGGQATFCEPRLAADAGHILWVAGATKMAT